MGLYPTWLQFVAWVSVFVFLAALPDCTFLKLVLQNAAASEVGLPGFISAPNKNANSHCNGKEPSDSFLQWRLALSRISIPEHFYVCLLLFHKGGIAFPLER